MEKGRRGFTLMEAVVAIAVVVIVSFAALTLALASVRAEERAVRLNEASILAENAVECYRAARDFEEFVALLEASGNGNVIRGNGGADVTIERPGYTVEMDCGATFGTGIVIRGVDDGEEFYKVTWPGQ